MRSALHVVRAAAAAFVLLSVALVQSASADPLTVAWDANADTVSGYRVYVGVQTGVYSQTFDTTQTQFTYAATPGQVYYIAVAAVAGTDVSALSAEVSGR